MVDRVFAALADSTRREVYSQLACHGPLTATSIAADLDVSRQAIAKHLGVLADAGMASSSRVGRETQYKADVAPLGEVQQWIGALEGEWTLRLEALRASLGGGSLGG